MPPQADDHTTDDAAENRCETETTVGGTPYRCSLETGHEGEHSYQPVDDDDEPEAVSDVAELTDDQAAAALGELMEGFEAELRVLLGADEPLTPVPMDGALGFMVPGMLELRTNDKYKRCPTCNGHGAVLTGSLADNNQTANCPTCGDRGYVERIAEQKAQPADNGAEPPAETDELAGYGVPTWMGDPSIGKTA